jgi:hypothetical protein
LGAEPRGTGGGVKQAEQSCFRPSVALAPPDGRTGNKAPTHHDGPLSWKDKHFLQGIRLFAREVLPQLRELKPVGASSIGAASCGQAWDGADHRRRPRSVMG